MKITKNKTIYVIFGVAIIYIGIALYSDISEISKQFIKMDWRFLALILPLEVLAFFIRSIRQKVLLDKIGIKLSFYENFKIFVAGLSMIITPGGSGEMIKSHFLKKKYDHSVSKTIPLVFIERFHDFLAVTTIIIVSLFFVYLWQSVILVVFASAFLISIYIIISNKNLLERFLNRMKRTRFVSKLTPSLEFNQSLILLTSSKTTLKAWPISFASWFTEILSAYFIFKAFGIEMEFIEIGQVVYTSILFGALSFLPAGIGLTEGTLIALMIDRGFELSIVSAMVLMLRMTTIWFATALGFIFTHRVLKN